MHGRAAIGEVIDERFRLVATLGAGAMGAVYRAQELSSGREVALKLVLEPERRPTRKERFRREGQVAAKLEHPGIVRVHTLGEHGGRPYLVYELVDDARDLGKVLPTLDRPQRLELIRQVAEALGHAHERGVVHRDVKPENILVTVEGQARVTDFGLALGRGFDRLTQTGGTVGTPYFMAPEQALAEREKVGPATDVWALGVILYTALTDAPPWTGTNIQEVSSQILAANPTPPRRIDPTIPPELEAIALRALAKEPSGRFSDGTAFAQALVAASARPPRRGRSLLLLLGAAAALTAVGLALTHRPPAGEPKRERASVSASPTPPPVDQPLAEPTGQPPSPTDRPLFQGKVGDAERAWFAGPDRMLVLGRLRAELISLSSGKRVRLLDPINTTAVAVDGARILVGLRSGGLVELGPDGRVVARSPFKSQVESIAISPDRQTVAVVFRQPAELLLLGRASFFPRDRQLLRAPARFLHYVGDEGHLLLADTRGELIYVNAQLHRVHTGQINGPPYGIDLTPAHDKVLVGDGLGSVFVFKLPSLKLEGFLHGEHPGNEELLVATSAHVGKATGVAVSADGARAWSLSGSKRKQAVNDLRVWDLPTRKQRRVMFPIRGIYGSLDIDPERRRLLFIRRDTGAYEVWSVDALTPK